MAQTYWELVVGYSAIWFIVVALVVGTVRGQREVFDRLEQLAPEDTHDTTEQG